MRKVGFGIFLGVVLLVPVVSVKALASRVISLPTPTPVLSVQRVNVQLAASPTPTPILKRQNNFSVTGTGIGLDVSKIGQERMLNPQPEPPIFALPEIKRTEMPSVLQIPQTLKGNGLTADLVVKPEYEVSGNRILLKFEGKKVEVKTPPSLVFQRLNYALTKNKAKSVGELMLEMIGGKPAYVMMVEVPVKILWLFPATMKEKVIVNDGDGKVSVVGKPWFAAVSREAVDLGKKLELLPNLVVKNIRLEPAQFGSGDRVNVIATVANEGAGLALGFPDMVLGGSGGPSEVLRFVDEGSNAYSWYPIIVYLEPGQTEERSDFYVNTVTCGENIRYEIADSDSSHIDETTKEDNALGLKLECSK